VCGLNPGFEQGPFLTPNLPCCAGVSLKTQELYALVFLTRYLDLFTNYVSL